MYSQKALRRPPPVMLPWGMDTTWLLSALAFAAAMSGTPGPNNAMLAASGATFGFNRTVPHMLGVAVGFPAMFVAVVVGAGNLLRTYPALHAGLRWVGAAYLLWLACKIAMADPTPRTPGDRRGTPLSFVQAALFQWVNPKAWIIVIGGVATYAGGERILGKAAALAAIFLVVNLLTVTFWTMTGVGAARVLRTRQGLRAFNLAMAGLLVLSLVPVLLEG